MSFDIYLEQNVCGHCGRGDGAVWETNLTHNVNEIVDACLVTGGAICAKSGDSGYAERSWGRLHGWTAGEVVPILTKAVAWANDPANEAKFRSMEPTNKWGTLESVRRVLAEMLDACREYQSATIRTSG